MSMENPFGGEQSLEKKKKKNWPIIWQPIIWMKIVFCSVGVNLNWMRLNKGKN